MKNQLLTFIMLTITFFVGSFTLMADTINDSINAVIAQKAVVAATGTTIISDILGSLSFSTYISSFFFAMLGLFLRHTIIVRKSIKKSTETPNKFSLKYWFANNFMTKLSVILTNIVVIFIALRFSVDLFSVEVSMFFSFLLGLSIDFVFDRIRKLQNTIAPK